MVRGRAVGLYLWLLVAGALFWWAPRAPSRPAVDPTDEAVVARLQEMSRRDAAAWSALYGDKTIPWAQANGHLAIVIDDVGREFIYSQRLLDLPFRLTFALVPRGRFTPGFQLRASQDRRRPRELMLHLPMEPTSPAAMRSGVELQEDFLLGTDAPDVLAAKTQEAFERVPLARGFNNHMGSKLTADGSAMRVVLAQARRAGARFFLDSRTTAETQGEIEARRAGMLTGPRDLFLDHDPSRAAVEAAFETALARARETPTVVIAHPSAAVVHVLAEGLPRAHAQGVGVYPLSEMLQRREAASVAISGATAGMGATAK